MPTKPVKCKLCGASHWQSEPHVMSKGVEAPHCVLCGGDHAKGEPHARPTGLSVMKRVATPVTSVATPITKETTPVTDVMAPVTPVMGTVTEAGVCVCPACEAPNAPRQYGSPAEKQRAYRDRKRVGREGGM
jgi:hypothetical protein